eukprot:gene3542-6277_t
MEKNKTKNFVFRQNPILHKLLIQFKTEKEKYEFTVHEDTIIFDFLEQIIKVIKNETELTLEDIKIKNLDGTLVSETYYESFPISLILTTINEICLGDLSFQIKFVIDRNSMDNKTVEESKMIYFDEHNDCKLMFTSICDEKKKKSSNIEKPYIISTFGKAKIGKSRIISELLSDEIIFQKEKNFPDIGSDNDEVSKTKDIHLFERKTKEKFNKQGIENIKFIDIESFDAQYQNLSEKIIKQRRNINRVIMPKLLYSFSDIILLIIEKDDFGMNDETINILLDAARKIEIPHFPELIIILNKEHIDSENIIDVDLKQFYSTNLKIFEELFRSIKIFELPISQINGEYFDKKIHELNLEIIENLKEFPNTKNFCEKDWFKYVEALIQNSSQLENNFRFQNQIKEHNYQKAIRLFHSFKENDTNQGYLHSFVISCKYLILQNNFSFIQWKKFLENLISKKPSKRNLNETLDDSTLFVDFKMILEQYKNKYGNQNDSSILKGEYLKLVSSKNNILELLKEINLDEKLLKKWKLLDNHFSKIEKQFPENLCTICQENKNQVFYFKCKHMLCMNCHQRLNQNISDECLFCHKKIFKKVFFDIEKQSQKDHENKPIISILGDFPNECQDISHIILFTKILNSKTRIIFIYQENVTFLYFNIPLNERDLSKEYCQISTWFSRQILENYGVAWKQLFSNQRIKQYSYQKHSYFVHFINVTDFKIMSSKNSFGEIIVSSKNLRFENILIDFSSFEDIFFTNDDFNDKKNFVPTKIGSLRIENYKKNKNHFLSNVVENLIEKSKIIKNDFSMLLNYLIIETFEEIYQNYIEFQVLDLNIKDRLFAYLLDFKRYNEIYKINEITFKNLKSLFEKEKYQNLKIELIENNFDIFNELLNKDRIENLEIGNLTSFELGKFNSQLISNIEIEIDLQFLDNSKMNEFKRDMLKLSMLKHKNIQPIIGYKIDKGRIQIFNKKSTTFKDYYQKLSMKQLIEMLKQIAMGIKYLHSQGITDEIINENTIYIENGTPKIGNLGKNALNKIGSILHLKPVGSENIIDIYQFGLILAFIANSGVISSENIDTTFVQNLKKKKKYPPTFLELIQRCCVDQNCNSIDIAIIYLQDMIN